MKERLSCKMLLELLENESKKVSTLTSTLKDQDKTILKKNLIIGDLREELALLSSKWYFRFFFKTENFFKKKLRRFNS